MEDGNYQPGAEVNGHRLNENGTAWEPIPSPPPAGRSRGRGKIIGGIVAGVALLAVVLIAAVLVLRGGDVPKAEHETLSDVEMEKVLQNPESHAGDHIILYAQVYSYDEGDSPDTFIGWAAHRPASDYVVPPPEVYYSRVGKPSWFEGDEDELQDLAPGQVVQLWVTVVGTRDWEPPGYAKLTVPSYHVNHLSILTPTST